ncbi:putative coil containing protein [Vibrio phage 199E37-1]|nr:putative coil containing protein [Vibrio phage 199E37-1]
MDTKQEEIATLYRLIEKHFGSGILMAFEDLISKG